MTALPAARISPAMKPNSTVSGQFAPRTSGTAPISTLPVMASGVVAKSLPAAPGAGCRFEENTEPGAMAMDRSPAPVMRVSSSSQSPSFAMLPPTSIAKA